MPINRLGSIDMMRDSLSFIDLDPFFRAGFFLVSVNQDGTPLSPILSTFWGAERCARYAVFGGKAFGKDMELLMPCFIL